MGFRVILPLSALLIAINVLPAAAGEANLMPPILEAARAEATEGEMISAMQEVFGTYTESPVF